MAQAEGRLVGGRYHLVEQIGRGGMGVVWRAHDELLDREVAVKEVRFDSAMGDELSDLNRRTMREARAAGRLNHPNVVVVHDVIEEDGRPWIVMQLVHSRSLGQVIRQDGPLSPERTAEIGLQILDALRAAHRQGVLHRDVKPENVLLAEDGRVVLTDFGIARIEADSTMTRTGLVGTPAFIPPERLRGYPAQRESDLWSLGATLYAAVEGKPPHDRGMAMATMHAVLNDDPAPVKRAGRLAPVLAGLLAKEPADRPGYDEITRLLKQATRPASPAKSPAHGEDSTARAADGSTKAGGGKAAAGGAAGGGAPGRGEPGRAGGKPYASGAKRPSTAEDDRSAATRKHTPSDKSPSEPAGTAAETASGSGEEAPAKEATGKEVTGKKAEAPAKEAPGKGASGSGTALSGSALSGSGRSGSGTAGDGDPAGPGEITSPMPVFDTGNLSESESELGTGQPGTAQPGTTSGGENSGGKAADPRPKGTARADKPKQSGKPDGAAKSGKADRASQQGTTSAAGAASAPGAEAASDGEHESDAKATRKPGTDRPDTDKPDTGTEDTGDAKIDNGAAAKTPSPASDKARRTTPATPMPETGTQAAPPAAKAVPERTAPSAATPGSASTTGGDAAGAASKSTPAAATRPDAASAAGLLAGLTPAPDPGEAAVPTQRSTVWPGNASTRPVGGRPTPMLKLALILVPVLLVIAGVAGYLGLREGERSSAAGTGEMAVGSTSSPKASPKAKPKKSSTAAASQPAPAAADNPSPGQEDEPAPATEPESTPSETSSEETSTDSPTPDPPTSQPADVPEGWYRYKDSTGFSVALPNGWAVSSRSGTQVWFRGPGTTGSLLIDQTSSPREDAEKDWRDYEPSARRNFPGYKLIKIEAVDYWQTAADWEFTYGSGSNRTHVVNRGFVTDSRHGYAIYWRTPDSRWEQDYHYFQTFTATFKPAK